VSVLGKIFVQISTGDAALSAIDTETTLIGGPSADVKSIWAAVAGSQALVGDMQRYYSFRKHFCLGLFAKCTLLTYGGSIACSTEVQISLSFGGNSWQIGLADMNLRTSSNARSSSGGLWVDI
jgi:cathepsin D